MSDKPAYWLEFLKHPRNLQMVLGVLGTSVLMSFPWGGDALILGGLLLAAVEVVGLAVVPGLGPFQQSVDRASRAKARAERRARLLDEVDRNGGSRYLAEYEAMCERVQSLYRTAGDANTRLSEPEVAQLDELTIDYLSLCLSDAVMRSSRRDDLLEGVRKKVRDIERQLESGKPGAQERVELQRLLREYQDVIERSSRLASRRSTLEAALISMPVRVEEVYQMVMTSPNAGNLAEMLEESVSRLRNAEQAAIDISMSTSALAVELGVGDDSVNQQRKARQALPSRD